MTVLVTDTGFGTDDWVDGFTPLADAGATTASLDLGPDTDPLDVVDRLPALRHRCPAGGTPRNVPEDPLLASSFLPSIADPGAACHVR